MTPRAARTTWGPIRRTFRSYFRNWKLSLPRSLASGVGTVTGSGWHIQWRTGVLRGQPFVDFYAEHRMTNDRHHRIFTNGRLGHLPARFEWILLPAGATPEEEEQIQVRYYRRNGRIAGIVRAKFEPRAEKS